MEIEKHKSLKPGSWIRIPIIYETNCQSEQKDAYHHAIIICPLLEIGFNATGTIIDKLHITSSNKIYDCSKYEIINKPKDYEQCELIIKRALKYYGTRKYSQMFNNCEHFASYCFNDKSESKQVKYTFWNGTSNIHQFIQNRSWFTNTVLFLNSYDIVSDETVDKICESNHKIGKFNGKIIDFCDDKANKNKIENQYDIKKMDQNNDENENIEQIHDEEKKEELDEDDIDQNEIVRDAKFVRNTIRDNLNEKGQIGNDKIDFVFDQIKDILFKYYQ